MTAFACRWRLRDATRPDVMLTCIASHRTVVASRNSFHAVVTRRDGLSHGSAVDIFSACCHHVLAHTLSPFFRHQLSLSQVILFARWQYKSRPRFELAQPFQLLPPYRDTAELSANSEISPYELLFTQAIELHAGWAKINRNFSTDLRKKRWSKNDCRANLVTR